MKQPIFILSSLLCICIAQHAWASDTLEEEELVPAPIVAEEKPVADNVQISDTKYLTDTMDELVAMRSRVDELLIPCESVQNLRTDDTIISNSSREQSVILAPMQFPKMEHGKHHKQSKAHKFNQAGLNLGEQSYYGETVYIINNFLYGDADNVSETDGSFSETDSFALQKSASYSEFKLRKSQAHTPESECPFDTPAECAVWLKKPVVSETVAPRSKQLRSNVMQEIAEAIQGNPNISANDKSMYPLLSRYRILMRASQSCCTGGITYKLKKAGASQDLIYKFLADDANFSGFGARCVVMSDEEIEGTKKYEATSATVADVRNNCICKSKATIMALLAPFEQLYKEYPAFANAPFEYRHHDGLGRAVTDSVNMDVQNVLDQLEMCP